MATQLPALAQLNRAVGPAYNAAADCTRWKNERAFFEAQIKRNWQIAAAVERQVPATVESLKLAARECASMGLTMSPTRAHVYFIPRRARKIRNGESKSEYERTVPIIVNATPSYRGLAYMACQFGGASMLAAEVVFGADKFRYFGPLREPEHEPTLDNDQRVEAKAIGVYAVVRMRDGSVRAEYVDAPTVYKIRGLSEFPNAMMWTKLFSEGWRKVPIRRICKTVMESSPNMAAAIEAMNRAEGLAFPGEDGGAVDADADAVEDHEPPRPRGVNGLGEALKKTTAPPAGPEAASPDPEADRKPYSVESKHPPGSIEYWCDQIAGAKSTSDLDDVRVAALKEHIDRSDIADDFRQRYKTRWHELGSAPSADDGRDYRGDSPEGKDTDQ